MSRWRDQLRIRAGDWKSRWRLAAPPNEFGLFGPYGAGNIGDDAVLEALLARHFDPERQRLAIISENAGQTARHVRRAQLATRSDILEAAAAVRSARAWLIAGGTMISDYQGLGFPFRYTRPLLESLRRCRKPHAMMGVGVNSVTTPAGRAFFRKYYDRVALFSVRDDHCGNALLDLGIAPDRIVVAADPVFAWQPARELAEGMEGLLEAAAGAACRIAVNVTHEEWRQQASLYEAVARCCDRLQTELGAAVVFFAADCRPGPAFDPAAIETATRRMRQSALCLPARNYRPAELATFLGRFDLVLSMRMHPLLLGALGGAVPVGVVRQPKMVRVLEEVGAGARLAAEALAAEPLFEACRHCLQTLPRQRALLQERLAMLARREAANRQAIAAVAA